MAKYPDFIVVGCMKCGTTVMWHNLNNHPDIIMGKNPEDPKKASTEIRFWNNGKPHHTWKKGIKWYKRLFSGDMSGEKCANYVESRAAMERMSQYVPNVKLILCVRNPIDRAYSEYHMHFHTSPGKNRKRNFREAIKKDKQYIKKGSYFSIIQNNILPFFPKKNLFISIQEWTKKNTNDELNKIYRFLGCKEIDIPVKKISPREKDVFIDTYKKWSSSYSSMGQDDRNSLLSFYAEENKKLFDYLGYSIDEWGS